MINTGKYTLEEHQIKPEFPGIQDTELHKKKREKKSKKCSLKNFDVSIKIEKMDDRYLEVDFIGVHFSLVNAYRRIVLAEVATMAIEKIHMFLNTTVVQDEVLSHRLGQVPLDVDPDHFQYKLPDSVFSAGNCVKYKLMVKGKKPGELKEKEQSEEDWDVQLVSKLVTSEHLQWVPMSNQFSLFAGRPPAPIREVFVLPEGLPADTNTDLVLAKLNPGHKLYLEAYAVKGIGSDHSKFQPGLCWYRMMPELTIKRPVLNVDARLLQSCFSPNVIDITTNENGDELAVVGNPREDSCSRNVHNYDNIKDSITIGRKADHIIFHVESHSALKSIEILDAAVDVMLAKVDTLLKELAPVKTE